MDFSYSDEQRQLRESVASFLRDHYPFDRRDAASRSEAGWRPEVWHAFAQDLGILSLCLPERLGGWGDNAIETMIVMEELGAALVIEPFLDTVVMAGSLLARADSAAADVELERIAGGEATYAFGWAEPQSRFARCDIRTKATRVSGHWRLVGRKTVVTGAPWASSFIVSARTGGEASDRDGVSLFRLDADATGLALQSYRTIDGRMASELVLDGVMLDDCALLGPEGQALPLIEFALDRATAALSAEALGVMRRMLADTMDYTRQRRQFGQPLSAFQALQHRMVEMFMQIEKATSAVYLACLNLGAPAAQRSRAVSAAKVVVSDACRFVGQNAVQLHGGMGMTDELALGHYFKRAMVIGNELGTADHHLARFAALSDAA